MILDSGITERVVPDLLQLSLGLWLITLLRTGLHSDIHLSLRKAVADCSRSSARNLVVLRPKTFSINTLVLSLARWPLPLPWKGHQSFSMSMPDFGAYPLTFLKVSLLPHITRDVPDFRTQYPNLLPGSGKDFLKGLVRLQKMLIGYQVGITITFNDAELWTYVSNYVKSGQQSGSGGISIFGFRFGASGSGTYQQSTSSIQVIQTGTTGQLVLPPTPPGVTVLLGALGKAL